MRTVRIHRLAALAAFALIPFSSCKKSSSSDPSLVGPGPDTTQAGSRAHLPSQVLYPASSGTTDTLHGNISYSSDTSAVTSVELEPGTSSAIAIQVSYDAQGRVSGLLDGRKSRIYSIGYDGQGRPTSLYILRSDSTRTSFQVFSEKNFLRYDEATGKPHSLIRYVKQQGIDYYRKQDSVRYFYARSGRLQRSRRYYNTSGMLNFPMEGPVCQIYYNSDSSRIIGSLSLDLVLTDRRVGSYTYVDSLQAKPWHAPFKAFERLSLLLPQQNDVPPFEVLSSEGRLYRAFAGMYGFGGPDFEPPINPAYQKRIVGTRTRCEIAQPSGGFHVVYVFE